MNRRMTQAISILGGIGVGAGLMYFLDPDRGKRRRALVRDKASGAVSGVRSTMANLNALSRDRMNRAYGVLAEARGKLKRESDVPDDVLEARVRSRMGHHIPHPGWVDVKAEHGQVTLSGHLPATEASELVECVSAVRGVKQIANRVEIH